METSILGKHDLSAPVASKTDRERDPYRWRETSLSGLAGHGIQWSQFRSPSNCIRMSPGTSSLQWALNSGARLDFNLAGQLEVPRKLLTETVSIAQEDGCTCPYVECRFCLIQCT